MRLLPAFRSLSTGLRNYSKIYEKTACVILAEGAEESETVITTDVLRRAGVNVTVAGLHGYDPIKCAQGVVIVPDASLSLVSAVDYDVVVLPGGQKGSENLSKSEAVGEMLKKQHQEKKLIAAICGGPIALKAHCIPADTVTSHPSARNMLENAETLVEVETPTFNLTEPIFTDSYSRTACYRFSEDRVVVAGNVITSQAPGTAFQFAVKIVEMLLGKEKATSLVGHMLIPPTND